MRVRWRGIGLGSLLAATLGCSEHPVPDVGRYGFLVRHANTLGADSTTVTGALVIERADEDQIEGEWDSEQLQPELADGRWVEGAYEVEALPVYLGRLVLRMAPLAEAGHLSCEGHYQWTAQGGVLRTVPVRCVVAPEGEIPVPTPIPPLRSPRIRDIDADSVPAPLER